MSIILQIKDSVNPFGCVLSSSLNDLGVEDRVDSDEQKSQEPTIILLFPKHY
ncbi:MAG: hypothetical protein US42_C0003G0023 [Candidatus Magasanikbacteria bacterium GW2011_GWC2_37_14]|uniref:Uncharacterized protein n=1 Tax=Candidatus Magasanikbacteria bacterium GW2011_GWC2_37_14 TaxID=1619046 RepID=A0A0G0JIQ7_9BACT|nr:MAG: hypothetical protein US42_C0003G0023 [Candidatus Magasanikbacteria bacterium GW2011_GWC2_37_14]